VLYSKGSLFSRRFDGPDIFVVFQVIGRENSGIILERAGVFMSFVHLIYHFFFHDLCALFILYNSQINSRDPSHEIFISILTPTYCQRAA
jgi:hypothetical protein